MLDRRHFLQTTACGFGSLALAAMAQGAPNPLAARHTHFPAKAKRVIFLFMAGGVSHVDSFDYKPRLIRDNGKMMEFEDQRAIAKTGMGAAQRIMQPLWEFKQQGESGRWASSLFPHMSQKVDEMCFVHSMHTEGVAHGPATLFLHTGTTNFIRPSMGSWISYGLGTENENLPSFVSISPSLSNGGPRNYGTAFLPAVHQGTTLGRAGLPARDATIRNLRNPLLTPEQQGRQFDLLRSINDEQMRRATSLAQGQADAELDAVINSYELAWRLQTNAPDTLDVTSESPATLDLYGINEKVSENFGRQCLMARKLAESGVRYIQVNYTDNSNNPAWDQHSNLPKHADHAAAVDKPIAGLLADLKQRGLLEDTLVWWGGEFGRTPYAERNGTGRDHNPVGFTQWLAGAGVKPGYAHGATDDFGHFAVQDKVHMHDMHATILHLLGLDHEKLTFRYAGRDFRLTDVHGHVVKELLT
ncbi:DUF1501 domain-containing protein [Verrucomicrobium sp. BvORR034]|jgi:hypothetical protein|uniref:DUF1501 domain-containing protein n=1 Tax=Verrucomicrobium sp. BvORR034 TaxID=1396418 RepID=UPI0006793D80|nr:DUF1501 domain-containing protein [Verrucomicrobium sp. BvORR034]